MLLLSMDEAEDEDADDEDKDAGDDEGGGGDHVADDADVAVADDDSVFHPHPLRSVFTPFQVSNFFLCWERSGLCQVRLSYFGWVCPMVNGCPWLHFAYFLFIASRSNEIPPNIVTISRNGTGRFLFSQTHTLLHGAESCLVLSAR